MKFAFFGTDEFSVKVLDTLKEAGLLPALIITVPDQPKGRKMVITPPPAKIWAEANGIEFIQPVSLKNLEEEKLKPVWDFFLVASYGKLIPQDILAIPSHGTLNIHPSLLPKYRGPSPLETAILNGDEETGVTIMLVDALMDHGPILATEKIKLADQYNFSQLRDKLAEMGAKLVVKILPDYLASQPARASKITPQAQDHSQATLTKKFTKEDGFIDQETPVLARYRKILALNPWPGTYLDYPGPKGKIRLIIKQAHLVPPERDKEGHRRYYVGGRGVAGNL